MNTIRFSSPVTDDRRRHLIFSGDFFLYPARPSVISLCDHAARMIRSTFGELPPETAQHHLSVEEFVKVIGPLKTRFTNDAGTKEIIRNLLADFGHDLDATYFDVPRLRVVTSDQYLTAGLGYAYKAHRDTWYSSPAFQINWWLPVYELESERTLALYPKYWRQPIQNSSAEFDYDQWTQSGRTAATQQIKTDTRKHPLPTEEVDAADELRFVMNSAESMVFSSSHLHATVPNTSGKTRFSIDFRTIHYGDAEAGIGSPNIDNRSSGTTLADFIKARDFSPIDVNLVSRVRGQRRLIA